ncbi:MAG: hypothetical protein HN368_10735 [Spirochaetales bacterium]|nr:hypothetical protein [Spirochaetales bacterium]
MAGKRVAATDLSITVVHKLPGRLRCRLSHEPRNWVSMKAAICAHPGIGLLAYAAVTRSILAIHDQKEISQEEFIIRLSVAISKEHEMAPVRLLASPQREAMSMLPMFAGLVLAGAMVANFLPRMARFRRYARFAAGVSTTLAVVEHGYNEVQETGNLDPEVLSVIYLVYSLIQGKGLSASMVTWVASFGRHLFAPPLEGILLKVKREISSDPENPSFDVAVAPDTQQPRFYSFLKYFQTIVTDALAGGDIGRDQLISRIRDVTNQHDSILEGIGKLDTNITIRID